MAQRIVLADKQIMFRTGVARVLSREPRLEVVAQCEDAETLYEVLCLFRDVTVVLPTSFAEDILELLSSLHGKGCRIVLIVEHNTKLDKALLSWAYGIVPRCVNGPALIDTLHRVAAGERVVHEEGARPELEEGHAVRATLERLTPKELQIVALVAEGWKNRQIAAELHTKEQVVKNYLRAIYNKTGTADRLELALLTIHHRALQSQADAQALPMNQMV